MKRLIVYIYVVILIGSSFNSQIIAQLITFQRYNSSENKVEDASDYDDPNIIYWSSNIKLTRLPILKFDINSVPSELISYTTQIASQASNCVDQWNTYGCLDIDYNVLYGCVLKFSSDPNIFTSTTQYGATLFAVTYTGNNYQFEVYPSQSLLYPITSIYLNGTNQFLYDWTATEGNIGIDYVPFKGILLHEMGHLVGLGHIYASENPVVMADLTIHNQFLFSLTGTDITALYELCDFNGLPTGIEDYIHIWIDYPENPFTIGYTYGGRIHATFLDVDPIEGDPDYIVQWDDWKMYALSNCGGEILIHEGFGGASTIPPLPGGYTWLRDQNGYVKAKLTRSGIDNDGHYHESYFEIFLDNVPNTIVTSGTLTSNTYWCGTINITGTITVPSDLTLKIFPGAIIKFASSASLLVYGTLEAIGCTFTSVSGTTPNSWGSISLSGSGASGSILDNATIQYGTRVEAINTSNIIIQNCSITNAYDGVRFSGSTGSILGNLITTASAGHGIIIENNSTATCNQNTITKTSTSKSGVGIIYRGGSGGTLRQNDLSGWDWGVGAIYGSSPTFSTPINGRNNRIRNCNTGVKVYESSWPTIGIPSPAIGNASIFGNSSYNVYFTSGGTLHAWRTYWDGTPTPSMFYIGSGSGIITDLWLSTDPWAGFAKMASDNNGLGENSWDTIYDDGLDENDDLLYYGVGLRLQNKFMEAKDFFLSYIAKHPDDQAAYVELYNCYNTETSDDIINFFTSLPKQAAKEHSLLLSYLYLKKGYVEMAKNINNAVIKDKSNSKLKSAAKINNIYIALYNDNDIDAAVAIFKELLGNNELSATLELSLAQQAIESYAKLNEIEIGDFDSPREDVTFAGDKFVLLGNHPNPFNPFTSINYFLPFQSSVELTIYDVMGSEIKSFSILSQSAGKQNIIWDGKNSQGENVSSGIYLYKLKLKSFETNDSFETTSKLLMLK